MAEPQKLDDEVKTYIVAGLACYDSPTAVAKAVKAEFGIDVSRQAVEAYDPTKRQGRELSDGLKELFHATRKAFIEDTAAIGASHKAVRVRRLDRMATAAEDRGNVVAAAQLLEQIAREMGGSFTNKSELEHTGKGGQPLTATVLMSGRPERPPPKPPAAKPPAKAPHGQQRRKPE